MIQLLHLVFVFTPGANLVTDEFSCQSASDEFNMNLFANRTKPIAKTCKRALYMNKWTLNNEFG